MRDRHAKYHDQAAGRRISAPHRGRIPANQRAKFPGLHEEEDRQGKNGRGPGGGMLVETPPEWCLSDACARKIGEAVAAALMTSRGSLVRGPATCVQPSGGRDMDDVILASTDIPTAIGARRTVLTLTADSQGVVAIKGFSFFVVQAPNAKKVDPFTRLRFSIRRNGQPIDPYRDMRNVPGFGIQSLRSSTILVKPEETVTLEVERFSGVDNEQFRITAAWKGWSYLPARHIDDSAALGVANAY